MSATNEQLIEKAASVVRPKKVGDFSIGDVGCALVTGKGNVYLGVCIDTGSSMGFCAEHNAIGSMITAGEYRIEKIVAVHRSEKGNVYVLSPCGRRREFMRQIDEGNLETDVVMDKGKTIKLRELLPYHDWFRKLD